MMAQSALIQEQYGPGAEGMMETTADQTIQEDEEITRAGRSAAVYDRIIQGISDQVLGKVMAGWL